MGDEESITVGGGGLWTKLRGRDPFLRVVLLLAIAAIGYFVNFNLSKWGEPFDVHKLLMEHRIASHEEHATFQGTLRAYAYIAWICSPHIEDPTLRQNCRDLNLQMPPEVRGMMKTREQ